MDDKNPLYPGDRAEGEAVRAHRQAMDELNAPAVTGAPKKDEEATVDRGSARNASTLPKNWKRIPDSELKKFTKPLGAPTYDKGGKVNVNDGKHQLAILKDGERVLTPEQNKEYEKNMPEKTAKPDNPESEEKIVKEAAAIVDKKPAGSKDCPCCYDDGGVVHSTEEKEHFHRAMSHLNAGGLHRHLGIAEGSPIPMAKKQAAANSDNPHVAAMGRMAVAMAGWHHKHGKAHKKD